MTPRKPFEQQVSSVRKQIYLYEELDHKLRHFALRRRVSESQVVRDALEAHFAESERPDLAKPRLSDAD